METLVSLPFITESFENKKRSTHLSGDYRIRTDVHRLTAYRYTSQLNPRNGPAPVSNTFYRAMRLRYGVFSEFQIKIKYRPYSQLLTCV